MIMTPSQPYMPPGLKDEEDLTTGEISPDERRNGLTFMCPVAQELFVIRIIILWQMLNT